MTPPAVSYRYRQAVLAATATIAARGVGVINLLITVPLALGYLGNERYGLWATVTSFAAIASIADFGIGLGLINPLAEAEAKRDTLRSRVLVSNALCALTVISGVLALVF